MTTTTKASARVMATDEKTGKRYVKTQTVEGATVTVARFVGVMTGDKYSWSSASYDVTSPAGELFAGAVKWNGKSFVVGGRSAPSLTKAVRAVLGTGQPAAPRAQAGPAAAPAKRTRKSAATRKAEKAAADQPTGGGVIDKDPDTGLPRIRPEVQAKADAIVAGQLARNAEAGK